MLRVGVGRVVRCDGVKIKPPAARHTALVSAVFARAQWSGFVDQSKQSAQAHAPLVLDAPGGGLLHRASDPNSLLSFDGACQDLQKESNYKREGCPTDTKAAS